jgi:hypothetical protein
MDKYCSCSIPRIDRAFLKAGFVYCSLCDNPVCCEAVEMDSQVQAHAAEIANEDHVACWYHWDKVADLTVRNSHE